MSAVDDLLHRNVTHEKGVDARDLPGQPSRRVAVVTCMDCRINVFESLGIELGEAHVLRNAGGAVTDDMIRSLAVSQRKLGTREVMLVHHTACGMRTFTETEFKDELESEVGIRPPWSVETFTDTAADVRQSVERIRCSPFLTATTSVRGFIIDIDTGELAEVHA